MTSFSDFPVGLSDRKQSWTSARQTASGLMDGYPTILATVSSRSIDVASNSSRAAAQILQLPVRVAVVAVPPVTAFDLTIPELVFGAVTVDGVAGYEVTLCTADPGSVPTTTSIEVVIENGLDVLEEVDLVVVTGSGRRTGFEPRVLTALRSAHEAGRRLASICTGAFVLADAGLLNGKSATTYWPYTDELIARFPEVRVTPNVLFTDDEDVLTSAGLAAGIDLCLHIVRNDYGAAAANTVARLVVVAPVRPGGQAQFIEVSLPPERGTSLVETREWALANLDSALSLAGLAAHAHLSVRTLTRRFQAETGFSPLQWLLHQRVDRARELLETTELPMTRIAAMCGLGGPETLRRHINQRVGLSPSAYRAGFTRR